MEVRRNTRQGTPHELKECMHSPDPVAAVCRFQLRALMRCNPFRASYNSSSQEVLVQLTCSDQCTGSAAALRQAHKTLQKLENFYDPKAELGPVPFVLP